MKPELWQRVTAVFQEALEAHPDERESIIEQRCGDNAALGDQVRRMLRHHDDSDSFLESPVAATEDNESEGTATDPLVGLLVGQFRILRRLATGGMGVVYEAEQENPRRAAAVKVLHPTHVTPAALRRFEYEAQVLGHLQHAGIARIYEAGTFDIGAGAQPYFAMELIDGPPITTFASEADLSVADRIQLLIKLCHAVQYAHQRGVIHRDLKPGNVLVDRASVPKAGADNDPPSSISTSTTVSESTPQPKVLDFGIARAIDSEIHATTMHTTVGELVGTISYMSPEQVAGDPNAVDALSDVYALGVIGFELLTGMLPYTIGRVSAPEAVRIIADQPPRTLRTVRRSLRGDLDTIIGKALEKSPSRRYQSAAELAADLHRYLSNEPIGARPPSAVYQLRKFAQRNRALVGGVVATLIALSGGTVMFAWQAQLARQAALEAVNQQEQASAVSSFLTAIFERIDPHNAGKDVNVRQLIDHAAQEIPVLFANQPLSEAAVRNEIGTIYYNLSLYSEARRHFDRALDIRRSELGSLHEDTLKVVNNVGLAAMHLDDADAAVRLLQEATDGRTAALGKSHDDTLVSMNNLAMATLAAGELDEAEHMLRQALATQELLLPINDKRTLTTKTNLASLVHQRGDSETAEQMLRSVTDGLRSKYGDKHITTLLAMGTLARILKDREQYAEAQQLFESQVSGISALMGPSHSSTLTARANLALVYEKRQMHWEAAEAYAAAADGFAAIDGPASNQSVSLRYRAAHSYRRNGAPAPAARAYQRVAKAYESRYGTDDDRTIQVLNHCRRMLRDSDQRDEAAIYAARIASTLSESLGPTHPDTIIAGDNHGRLLLDLNRFDEAVLIYEQLCDASQQAFGEDDWRRGVSLGNLGECLLALGRLDEADRPLKESLQYFELELGENDSRLIEAHERLQRLDALRQAAESDRQSAMDTNPKRPERSANR